MKNRVSAFIGIAVAVFILIYLGITIAYLHHCIIDWKGNRFIQDFGVCTNIHTTSDSRAVKTYIEIDKKHIYYVNMNYVSVKLEDIYALQGSSIHVVCMPPTIIQYDGMVVSIATSEKTIINSEQLYDELRGQLYLNCVILILLSFICFVPIVIMIFVVVATIRSNKGRKT